MGMLDSNKNANSGWLWIKLESPAKPNIIDKDLE